MSAKLEKASRVSSAERCLAVSIVRENGPLWAVSGDWAPGLLH